jgi:hypothetical protein
MLVGVLCGLLLESYLDRTPEEYFWCIAEEVQLFGNP